MDVELDAAEYQQQKYLHLTLNLRVPAESLETHGLSQRDYTQENPSHEHNVNVAIYSNDVFEALIILLIYPLKKYITLSHLMRYIYIYTLVLSTFIENV